MNLSCARLEYYIMNLRKKDGRSPKSLLIMLTVICGLLLGISSLFQGAVAPLSVIFANIVIPMQEGVNSFGSWFGDNVGSFKTLSELREENKILRERVESLENQNEVNQTKGKEVERLQQLVKLDRSYKDYDTVAARVISNSDGNWYSEFIINKGSKDGVQKNMNVVTSGGLVGIITEVSAKYATVRTIIDDKSSISAMSKETGDTCIVNGDNELMMEKEMIRVSHISKDAEMNAGDELITSHISSKYLEGLTIGTVTNIKIDASNLTQTAVVTPAVDFSHIETVLVIKQIKQLPEEAATAD